LLERGDHVVTEAHVAPPEELHHRRIGQPAQSLLVDGVESLAVDDPAVVELCFDVDRLDELQLEEAGNEVPGHLDPRLQVLESPDDALQVPRGLTMLGEERLALLDAYPRVIEVDRDIGSMRVERYALQAQWPVELQVAPLLEEEVLPLVESEHGSAVELAGIPVLREEYRVMHQELRKLVDDHEREALIVTIG